MTKTMNRSRETKMSNSQVETVVIFRKWSKQKGGSIVAIFPEEPAAELFHCSSYENIGQHGACDPAFVIRKTRPATASESKTLRKELKSRGYILKEINRYREIHYRNRQKNMEKMGLL